MVMPCYNKRDYIGEMFDSIIAQDWDNIELILVNDGSTDGTRDVIAEYELCFRARGYDVVIIDQENAGVCAAAKAGLSRITGDYVCQVDADDELDPAYVSTMAGWLEAHKEYDYCACDVILYEGSGNAKAFKAFAPRRIKEEETLLTERFLLTDICSGPWVYMVRVGYLQKCDIIDAFETNTRGSHEPGYIIPLLSNGGRYKYFSLPLYHFNFNGEGHSRSANFLKMKRYLDEYAKLCHLYIAKLPNSMVSETRRKRLSKATELSRLEKLYRYAVYLEDGAAHIESTLEMLFNFVNTAFNPVTPVTAADIIGKHELFVLMLRNKLLERQYKAIAEPNGRVIAYGALGRVAGRLFPLLRGTILEPNELWDRAGDGVKVVLPDFRSLDKEDLILIFPINENIQEMVRMSANCHVMDQRQIQDFLAWELFGKWFNG
jgi:glycosyltransferase involved in cell wall biosynthesis